MVDCVGYDETLAADATLAYEALAHGTVSGRAVIVPNDSYRP